MLEVTFRKNIDSEALHMIIKALIFVYLSVEDMLLDLSHYKHI